MVIILPYEIEELSVLEGRLRSGRLASFDLGKIQWTEAQTSEIFIPKFVILEFSSLAALLKVFDIIASDVWALLRGTA
jgi:hypothetical protein